MTIFAAVKCMQTDCNREARWSGVVRLGDTRWHWLLLCDACRERVDVIVRKQQGGPGSSRDDLTRERRTAPSRVRGPHINDRHGITEEA